VTAVDTPPRAAETAAAAPPAALRPDAEVERPEVLVPEARRRERRRRLSVLAIVVTVLGGAGVGYALSSGTASPGARAVPSPGTASQPTVPTAAGGPLKHPYGLAIANNGDLYIVDTARDQVLRRLPSGKFHVVAGDGHRGFSGDGRPAIDAELSLGAGSGIVIAKDGTLYIADSGNDRVRAVSPDGMIKTVAGDGTTGSYNGQILRTTPALDASFGAPSGLAIGRNGDLYIAAGNVVRLTPNGLIEWVAGKHGAFACGFGIYCNPAGEADFTYPGQLAFDGAGDLFVAVDNGPSLYEIAASGRLAYLGQFRANGGGRAGALAEAPDGTVVEAGTLGLARLPANGRIKLPKAQPQLPRAPGEAITGNLDHALGRNKELVGGYNVFIGGDGVAAGPGGAVYADTNTGIVTSVSALVEVKPGGKVLTLWRS
jgi:DNA-binding beta-propeller fold protein YncE